MADAHRPRPGSPVIRHQTAHALGELVDGRASCIGARMAEARCEQIG